MNRILARSLLKLTRPERVRLLKEIVADQWRSPAQLADLSTYRLTGIMRHAAATVPYYSEFCRQAGLDPASLDAGDLVRFPLVHKQDMIENSAAFQTSAADRRDCVPNSTGGSSGKMFNFLIDRKSLEIRTANDLRGRTWTGWRLGDKQAILWGHPRDNKVTHSLRGKLLGKFVHRSRNLNAFDMDDRIVADFAGQLRHFNPVMILGYSSALAFFSEYLASKNIKIPSPKGIISSAETLTPEHRSSIESYFACPLLNRYGSREFGDIAQQCEAVDGLHIFSDRYHLEVLRPDGTACVPGEQGEIVITDFDNRVMPFIRYRTGDLATPASGSCGCGRGFPLLASVSGRTSELVVGKNGKYYSCPGPRWWRAGIEGVGQMQLVQEDRETIEIRLVPDGRWNESSHRQLEARMKELLGEIDVVINLVDALHPLPSGKFPFVISSVSPFTD
jgi:phenylacetate-CoA ligase